MICILLEDCMADKLNIDNLKLGFDYVKIGVLTKELIDLLNLNCDTCDIILWEDRFKYIEKHKYHFKSEIDFERHIAAIPEVIENPDYVGVHQHKNSLEFIKRIDELLIVVVRIKQKGDLAFRTMYPLSERQLQDYLKSGTVVEFKKRLTLSE